MESNKASTDSHAGAQTDAQGVSRSGVRYLEAGEQDAGQRIDNFLARNLRGVPQNHIRKIIRSGQVRVNKGRKKPDYRIQQGDSVRVPPIVEKSQAQGDTPPEALQASLRERIIAEDDYLIVIDKPAGLAVHGGSGLRWGLIEAMRAARPELERLELVHRLDRETSGCLILAKQADYLRQLHGLLRGSSVLEEQAPGPKASKRQQKNAKPKAVQQNNPSDERMDKYYLTLVVGHWNDSRTLRSELSKNKLQGGERVVQEASLDAEPASNGAKAKASQTHFRPLEHYAGSSLLEAKIDTGRTHQIRVQSAGAGHPVLGDEKYGDAAANARFAKKYGLKRMFLHAHRVAFTCPVRNEVMEFSAPVPEALRSVLEQLPAYVPLKQRGPLRKDGIRKRAGGKPRKQHDRKQ